jgi:hypothetical protein
MSKKIRNTKKKNRQMYKVFMCDYENPDTKYFLSTQYIDPGLLDYKRGHRTRYGHAIYVKGETHKARNKQYGIHGFTSKKAACKYGWRYNRVIAIVDIPDSAEQTHSFCGREGEVAFTEVFIPKNPVIIKKYGETVDGGLKRNRGKMANGIGEPILGAMEEE